MPTVIENISQKIDAGKRVTDQDALALFQTDDLISLGRLANRVREAKYGDKTFYIINRHIDYSNICALKCRFCAFARKKGDKDGFELKFNDIVNKVEAGLSRGITEVHIVGGMHPDLPWDFYTGMLKTIRDTAPQIHIKAFTAAEIRYFSKKFRKTEEGVLKELIDAGLDSLPGGGAEIFSEKVREEICGPKGPAENWLSTHRLVHNMGMKSNATMLYGHIESIEDRVDHMRRIRDLQDETGGFLSFIPLSFNPKGTEYESRGYTSGVDDLKTLAISRIYLDNMPHIKAYWVMSGVDTAQLAQYFGADDLHGTVMEENITHMAGAQTPEDLPEAKMVKLICDAGRVPVKRDSLYNEISALPMIP